MTRIKGSVYAVVRLGFGNDDARLNERGHGLRRIDAGPWFCMMACVDDNMREAELSGRIMVGIGIRGRTRMVCEISWQACGYSADERLQRLKLGKCRKNRADLA